MNLSLTHIDCICFTFYYGHPTASAAGSVDEDKSCSVSNGTTFGSVEGGTMLASDLVSTPSVG